MGQDLPSGIAGGADYRSTQRYNCKARCSAIISGPGRLRSSCMARQSPDERARVSSYHFCFALGEAFEERNEYRASFRWL
jgi:hypothetical protein